MPSPNPPKYEPHESGIVKKDGQIYVGRKHAGKKAEVWFLRDDERGRGERIMDTYTGKIIEYDVEIQTSRGESTAKRWVLNRGTHGFNIVENIFNKYEGKVIKITIEEI